MATSHDLSQLNPAAFEHLVNALVLKVLVELLSHLGNDWSAFNWIGWSARRSLLEVWQRATLVSPNQAGFALRDPNFRRAPRSPCWDCGTRHHPHQVVSLMRPSCSAVSHLRKSTFLCGFQTSTFAPLTA